MIITKILKIYKIHKFFGVVHASLTAYNKMLFTIMVQDKITNYKQDQITDLYNWCKNLKNVYKIRNFLNSVDSGKFFQ